MQNENVPQNLQRVLQIDQKVRKDIADLFMSLNDLNDPHKSIEILADHVAMMIEMINEVKSQL